MSGDTWKCPNCKHAYSLEPVRAGGVVDWQPQYKERTMSQMHFGSGKSSTVKQATRRVPLSTARPSLESSFRTPLAISLATGGFAIVSSVFVFHFDLRGALTAGVLVAFAMWGWQVKGDRSLLSYLEVLTNRDWDGDDRIGETPKPEKSLRITVTEKQKGAKSWTGYFDSPVEEPVLGQFARAFLAGRPMGERNWTGAGQPFSVNEYVDFRDELMARGLLRWKNDRAHRQGFRLTLRGERVFRELAAIPATTPPELQQ